MDRCNCPEDTAQQQCLGLVYFGRGACGPATLCFHLLGFGFLKDRVSLLLSKLLGAQSVDQANLELKDSPASTY